MGQGHFPGPRDGTTADEARHGNGMVGASEGPLSHDIFRFIQTGDAINLRHLQRFLPRHRRQDGGDAASQHRFTGAGRSGHEHIVSAGSGDFHGLLGEDLPLHLGIVHVTHHFGGRFVTHRRRHRLPACEKFHQLPKISWTIDCDIFTKKCFACHFRRHDEFRDPCLTAGQHHRKDAGHRADFSFQR